MNKNEAIEIARTTHNVELERANTHFSNVNQKKPVWWIEFPLRKLDEHNQINLVVEKSGVVTLLEVPTSFLKENLEGFRIRDEKQMLCLDLDIETFRNVIGADKLGFKQFVT